MPHSIFLGRPVPRAGEPMWLEDDQDKVLAYLATKAEDCPDCGTREADWVDGDGHHLDRPAWDVTTRRCYGCAAMAEVSAQVPDGEKGVRVVLLPYRQAEL